MQITCMHCGSNNPDSYRFCVVCGARLGVAPASARTGPMAVAPVPVSASASGSALTLGALLAGRYTIERILGRGGMSTVYRGYDTRFSNRLVAVKEMVDSFATPAERAEAERDFLREADLLATLRHPAIPAVFDRFSANQRHYLVLEYIEGENLEGALAQRTAPYPEAQVRSWALELCALLRYLHDQQPPVIFRDLKPGNILVDPQGRLRLIDFGIARFFRQTQSSDTTPLGTSGYASPEHYTGQTDARSDIYSLGATLHHLLTLRDPTRQPPFQFPPVRSINAAVSTELDELIGKTLHPDRTGRYGSVTDVEAALRGRPRPLRPRPAPAPPSVDPAQAPASGTGSTAVTASGALVLVITRVGRGADTAALANELAVLLGRSVGEAADLFRRLPIVEPVANITQLGRRLKRLQDLGADARQVVPATESVHLGQALQQELLTHHQIEIWDTTVGASRTCRCWRCGHRWQTRNAVGSPVPERCPNPRCRAEDWSHRRLCKCAWCGHEFEVREYAQSPDRLRPFCECCGLRDWLQGRRGGWQGLVQTFRDLLGLPG